MAPGRIGGLVSFEIRHGDALEVLRSLPAEIAQTCITSPPYWGLRDYGHAGQIGLEEMPELYVARLVEVFRELRRVLRDDGTLWLNLGDSYAATMKGGGGIGSGTLNCGPELNAASTQRQMTGSRRYNLGSLKPKDLVGIPWRVAFALQADGWYLRSDIIWHKPNPMPESVTDRPTKGHEYLFLLAKNERYHYEADAIAEEGTGRAPGNKRPHKYAQAYEASESEHHRTAAGLERQRDGYETRNRRSVWTVATSPFPEARPSRKPSSSPASSPARAPGTSSSIPSPAPGRSGSSRSVMGAASSGSSSPRNMSTWRGAGSPGRSSRRRTPMRCEAPACWCSWPAVGLVMSTGQRFTWEELEPEGEVRVFRLVYIEEAA